MLHQTFKRGAPCVLMHVKKESRVPAITRTITRATLLP